MMNTTVILDKYIFYTLLDILAEQCNLREKISKGYKSNFCFHLAFKEVFIPLICKEDKSTHICVCDVHIC